VSQLIRQTRRRVLAPTSRQSIYLYARYSLQSRTCTMHAETRPLPVKSLLLRVLRPTLEYAKTRNGARVYGGDPSSSSDEVVAPPLSLSLSLSLSSFPSSNSTLVDDDGFVAGK